MTPAGAEGDRGVSRPLRPEAAHVRPRRTNHRAQRRATDGDLQSDPSPNLRAATVAGLACLAALAGCSSVESLSPATRSTTAPTARAPAGWSAARPDPAGQGHALPAVVHRRRQRLDLPGGARHAAPLTQVAAAGAPPTQAAPPRRRRGATAAAAPDRAARQRSLAQHHAEPEQVYPQVRAFWKDNGFNLAQDRPEAGVVETEWVENRAKLPTDFVRRSIGRVFENAYSTGELDKFRTRVERTATGSDIYVSPAAWKRVHRRTQGIHRLAAARPPTPRSRPSSWRA